MTNYHYSRFSQPNMIYYLDENKTTIVNELFDTCIEKEDNNKTITLIRKLDAIPHYQLKDIETRFFNRYGNSIYFVACENGNTDLLHYFYNRFKNEDDDINDENGIYHPTQKEIDGETIASLFEPNPTYAYEKYLEPVSVSLLWIASKRKHFDTVKYLCEKGANIYYENMHGVTVLHAACSVNDNSRVCEYLLEAKAGDKEKHELVYGYTPLHFLIKYGGNSNVRLLEKMYTKHGGGLHTITGYFTTNALDLAFYHDKVGGIIEAIAPYFQCDEKKKLKVKLLNTINQSLASKDSIYNNLYHLTGNIPEEKDLDDEALLKLGVKICEEIFQPNHFRVKIQLYNLYTYYKNNKDFEEATEILLDLIRRDIDYRELKFYLVLIYDFFSDMMILINNKMNNFETVYQCLEAVFKNASILEIKEGIGPYDSLINVTLALIDFSDI